MTSFILLSSNDIFPLKCLERTFNFCGRRSLLRNGFGSKASYLEPISENDDGFIFEGGEHLQGDAFLLACIAFALGLVRFFAIQLAGGLKKDKSWKMRKTKSRAVSSEKSQT